jgi:cobalt-zinc-cadmium efflux system membrane fusion protein
MTALLLLLACSGRDAHDDHDDHAEHTDAHDVGEARHVSLTPQAVEAARIVVAPAEMGQLINTLDLPGHLALDPRREAQVSPWIAGQIDAVRVRPGDTVSRGQVLGMVQTPDLGQAVAAFRTAKAADDAADARLERLERLELDGVASRSQVLDAQAQHAEAIGALEAAEERLRILGVDPTIGDPHAGDHFPSKVPVRSPIAGKVLQTHVTVGETVSPSDTLFHIGDLDQVWLLLDVYERNLSAVATGQSVSFTVDAWPDEVFHGVVEQVGDWVHPDARTVEVRVVVDNPGHRLKPNMYAQAQVALPEDGAVSGVILPQDALTKLDGQWVVFIQEQPGQYQARNVEVAQQTTDRVRLEAGVQVGEQVVVDGAFALASELEKGALGHGHAH